MMSIHEELEAFGETMPEAASSSATHRASKRLGGRSRNRLAPINDFNEEDDESDWLTLFTFTFPSTFVCTFCDLLVSVSLDCCVGCSNNCFCIDYGIEVYGMIYRRGINTRLVRKRTFFWNTCSADWAEENGQQVNRQFITERMQFAVDETRQNSTAVFFTLFVRVAQWIG